MWLTVGMDPDVSGSGVHNGVIANKASSLQSIEAALRPPEGSFPGAHNRRNARLTISTTGSRVFDLATFPLLLNDFVGHASVVTGREQKWRLAVDTSTKLWSQQPTALMFAYIPRVFRRCPVAPPVGCFVCGCVGVCPNDRRTARLHHSAWWHVRWGVPSTCHLGLRTAHPHRVSPRFEAPRSLNELNEFCR